MSNSYSEITIEHHERESITQSFRNIKYDPTGSDEYISALRKAAYESFPNRVLDLLSSQRSSVNPSALIAIHGLPIDDGIVGSPPPSEGGEKYKQGHLSENVLAAVSSLIGEPYSILSEGEEFIANLTPEKASKLAFDINGSEMELDYHIENSALRYLAHEDCSPIGVALIGVRHDESAPLTRFSDVRLALKLLSPADIDTLFGKNFIIKLPHRWRGAFFGNVENTEICALLTGPRENPRASGAYYKDITHAINQKGEDAFRNLHAALKQVERTVDIKPGSYTYVDNRFAFHARDKFLSAYDENDRPYRWLQRVYVAPNLWNFRSFRRVGWRVFDPAKIID